MFRHFTVKKMKMDYNPWKIKQLITEMQIK